MTLKAISSLRLQAHEAIQTIFAAVFCLFIYLIQWLSLVSWPYEIFIEITFFLCLPAVTTFYYFCDLKRHGIQKWLWSVTIKFYFKKTWDAKTQPCFFFFNTGGEDLFLRWSRVGHALCPIFMLWLVKIWQLSSCGKFMQHLESSLLSDSWSWQRIVSTCDVLTVFFSTGCTKWDTAAIKSPLLFVAGLFIGFLVEKCVACQGRLSDFGWHLFCFSPCLMRRGF